MNPGAESSSAPTQSQIPAPTLAGAISGLWLMTWRGALAWRNWPALLLLLVLIPALIVFTPPAENAQAAYFQWLIPFYLLLILPLYALIRCGGMIRDELHADTLSFLLTRPVTRARYFFVRYLTLMLWMQVLMLGHGILLAAAGFIRQVDGLIAFLPIFFTVQFLAVLAWTAWSALLGLVSRRYIVLGLIYWFVVEMGIGRIPTNINTLSLSRHLKTLLALDDSVAAQFGWPIENLWIAMIALPAAVLIFLIVSAFLFTFREYHSSEESAPG